jgi:hypothetical protein
MISNGRTQDEVDPHSHLLLQAKSLYCQHPKNPYNGFAIIYSHRGQSLYPNLDAEAQSFIDGVQVPAD